MDELYRIGVDEIFYRKPHRFLTAVADRPVNQRTPTPNTKSATATKDSFVRIPFPFL